MNPPVTDRAARSCVTCSKLCFDNTHFKVFCSFGVPIGKYGQNRQVNCTAWEKKNGNAKPS